MEEWQTKKQWQIKKWQLFLITLVVGGTITFNDLLSTNFSGDGFQSWVLDTLLVAALLGFVSVKYLKSKGRLR
jgi:hypothetical protein